MVRVSVDKELLAAVGRLTVSFNVLEFLLGIAIQQIGRLPNPAGEIITGGLRFRNRSETFVALCKPQMVDADGKRLEKLKGELKRAEDRRNHYTHAILMGSSKLGESQLIKHTGGPGGAVQTKEIKPAEVNNFAEKLEALSDDVLKLAGELGRRSPPGSED